MFQPVVQKDKIHLSTGCFNRSSHFNFINFGTSVGIAVGHHSVGRLPVMLVAKFSVIIFFPPPLFPPTFSPPLSTFPHRRGDLIEKTYFWKFNWSAKNLGMDRFPDPIWVTLLNILDFGFEALIKGMLKSKNLFSKRRSEHQKHRIKIHFRPHRPF